MYCGVLWSVVECYVKVRAQEGVASSDKKRLVNTFGDSLVAAVGVFVEFPT